MFFNDMSKKAMGQ